MSLKASISGIRGIIGESLTPEVIANYIASFSQIIPFGKVLLGRDSRLSGNQISCIVKSTLNMLGRDVVDLGIVPTPVVLYGVHARSFSGGIIITASHNPEEWNALKFVNNFGKFLSPAEFNKLSANYEKKNFNYVSHNRFGSNHEDDKIPLGHMEKILKLVNSSLIKKNNFKVAVDAVNGGGSIHAVEFLKKLDCQVIDVFCKPTGKFPHPAEPKPENLKILSNTTRSSKANVGFAIDPDGDRLVVADETGTVLSEELTLALCVKHYLKKFNKSSIVINNSTSRVIEDIAEEFGVKVYRTPTGEINVTEKMERVGAKIGGEGNGGIIVHDTNKCRDAFVGIALILDMMAKENKKIKDIVSELPKYFLIKDKVNVKNIDLSKKFLNKVKKDFKVDHIDTTDGIRIELPDAWVLVRKSNTEPIVRIFAEAKNGEAAKNLIEKARTVFKLN